MRVYSGFRVFSPPQMHLLEVSHQMKVQHVVCQQISLPVMQVCPDRNSVNQPEAADDDIPASPSQVMSGSVKSRALAQEVCWAFSHVCSKQKAVWVILLMLHVHASHLAATVVNVQVYNLFMSRFKVFICSSSFFFYCLFNLCTYQGHL